MARSFMSCWDNFCLVLFEILGKILDWWKDAVMNLWHLFQRASQRYNQSFFLGKISFQLKRYPIGSYENFTRSKISLWPWTLGHGKLFWNLNCYNFEPRVVNLSLVSRSNIKLSVRQLNLNSTLFKIQYM